MTTKTIDLHGPYIRETTGLEYESFASWLAGDDPLDTARNRTLQNVILAARLERVGAADPWPEGAADLWWRTYDAYEVVSDPRGDFGSEHVQRNNAAFTAVLASASVLAKRLQVERAVASKQFVRAARPATA